MGRGARAWRGAGSWGRGLRGPPGGMGPSRPGPQLLGTNRRRTRSRQEAREGEPGRPLTPPCPGLHLGPGRGQPVDTPPAPLPGLRPPGPSGIPAPSVPWGPGKGAGRSGARAPRPLAWGAARPTSARGQGQGHEAAWGWGFSVGARPRLRELGLDWDGGLLRLTVGGCPGYWGQGGISPAQAKLG